MCQRSVAFIDANLPQLFGIHSWRVIASINRGLRSSNVRYKNNEKFRVFILDANID